MIPDQKIVFSFCLQVVHLSERGVRWNQKIPYNRLVGGDVRGARETHRDALVATDDASPTIRSKVALLTDPNQCGGSHERVADGTLAVALFAQSTNGDARQLAAEDQIWMMLRHGW